MRGIDAALEGLYRRLGWRMVLAYQAVSWAGVVTIAVTCTALFARIDQLSPAKTISVIVVGCLVGTVPALVSSVGIARSVRPLRSWLVRPRDPAGANTAWRIVARLPTTTLRWNVAAMLAVAPVEIAVAASIGSVDLGGVIWITVGFACATAILAAGSLFLAQLASRPLARDVADSLSGRPPWSEGVSMRLKLLAVLPPIIVATAGWGVALGLEPGTDLGGALPQLLAAMVGAVVFAVPIALLLAYSSLQPLDDLLQASKRLEQGDFGTRTPSASGRRARAARPLAERCDGRLGRARAIRDRE